MGIQHWIIMMKTAIILVAFLFCPPIEGSKVVLNEIRTGIRIFWVNVHSFVPLNAAGNIRVSGRNCISPLKKPYSVTSQLTQSVPFSRGGWNCYVEEITATLSNGVVCPPFINSRPWHYWNQFQITGDDTNCIVTHY